MSRRAAAWLAWSIWALCVALLALTVLLDNYTPPAPDKGISNVYAFVGVPLLVYVTVWAFVGSRRPKNPVDWILCGMASGRAGRDAGSKRDGMSLKRRGA